MGHGPGTLRLWPTSVDHPPDQAGIGARLPFARSASPSLSLESPSGRWKAPRNVPWRPQLARTLRPASVQVPFKALGLGKMVSGENAGRTRDLKSIEFKPFLIQMG